MAIMTLAENPSKVEGRPRSKRRRAAGFVAALALGAALCGAPHRAAASTDGSTGGLLSADGILFEMGFPFSLYNIFVTPETLINVDATFYGYIKNDYIGVVIGDAGTYSTPYDTKHSVTHHSAGMITFGNQKGSLLTGLDDLQGLVGLNTFDFFTGTASTPGISVGYGVWPIPNWAETTGGAIAYDTSAYTRAQIDNTTLLIVGGDPAQTLIAPRFENNALSTQYRLLPGTGAAAGTGIGIGGLPGTSTSDVVLDQVIELYRATARIHWRIYNGDSNSHTVTLRFTLPVRAPAYTGVAAGLFQEPNTGFYYVDPVLGATTQTNVVPGSSLPDVLDVYGQRYDDPTQLTVAPFAAATRFRQFGATVPTSVWLSDGFDVRPNTGGFNPTDLPDRRGTFESALAESLYFGPYTLPPGTSQDVYTFYGNGRPTEDLRDDVTVGVEGTEAAQINTDEFNDAKIISNKTVVTDPTLLAQTEAAFLKPSPIQIQGSVYNRTLPQNSAYLTGVTMSLILPASQGLVLTTPPGQTTIDTATKAVGSVAPDTDQTKQWYIQATGTVSGVLTYQLTTTSKEIGSRTLTRTISVPAVPLHPVTSSSFQLLGFPFQFDKGATNQADPATIINTLSPSSLQDNPAVFYYWVPSSDSAGNDNGKYVIATSLQPGQGYFFRPASTRIIFPYGASPVSGQTPNTASQAAQSQVIQLSLNQGWNMITDPYLYSIPLAQVRITQSIDGVLNGSSQPFLTAANAGLVRGSVFFFRPETGDYDFYDFGSDQPVPQLNPWVGYWIFAETNIILTYTLPTTHNTYIVPSSTGGEPSTRGVLTRTGWQVKGPSLSNWTLQLVAQRTNGKSDHAAIIGVKPDVTTRNAVLPKPPAPASDYVYIGLVNPSAKTNTRYAEIFQSPSSTAKTWNFEVSSDHDGPVTLGWPNAATLPRQLSLTLRDVATGKVISLRGQSSMQVALKANRSMHYELTAKPEASTPLAITGLHAVRSGGGTRSVGMATDIVFSLTQDATVTAQIKSMNGRVIGTLDSGRAASTGQTILHWTGRHENGSALAPGMYIIKVIARTEDGHSAEQELNVTSLR